MTDRTITALYGTRAEAERARDQLAGAGLADLVDINEQASAGAGADDEGFFNKMKTWFGGHEDTHAYGEGLRRGHFLLTARVDELRATEAATLLGATTAVDFDQAEQGWKSEGWSAPATGFGAAGAGYDASIDRTADLRDERGLGARGAGEEVIPLVEERLTVGKREVERGGVRVRSYVVETPVDESVTLRDERVSIERRPVDRAVAAGDAAFRDRDISLTETAEEAVVAKDAFVREEILVRKEAGERVEQVHDTVRRTEVEVEDTTRRGETPRAI